MTDNTDNRLEAVRSRIREFPASPGVYIMKDNAGLALYIGKAASLRDRAMSYFQPSADLASSRGPKIVEMVARVHDVSFLECDSEVDAILQEARLIKDIHPPYNTRQLDDKTFPYIEITRHDDYPAVYITREPHKKSKLYGPFTSISELRRVIQVLQRIFRFRTCRQEILADDPKLRFNRPCILHSIKQCTGPCAGKITKEAYALEIKRLMQFLESKRAALLRQLHKDMTQASEDLNFEEAARLRDEIKAIEALNDRGKVDEHVQPELFQIDPAQGMRNLERILDMPENSLRVIEGYDIAHIQGTNTVASQVCFIDGRPFKNGYRRYKIKTVKGIDDFASMAEVMTRRFAKADPEDELFPNLVLIDGGLGQLNAALEIVSQIQLNQPAIISLAKREEELYIPGKDTPIRISRHDPALRILQHIRDEAHRFAQHYFHILQHKNV